MKSQLLSAGLLTLLATTPSVHAAPPESELIFNCELTNGKYVIVRLDHDVPTYYYGSLEKVEMTLPQNEGDKTQVRLGEMTFSGGGAYYYRFINGNYSYVVYSGTGKGWDYTGLKVYKNQKLIMKKECTNGGFLPNEYRGQGLVKEADTGDDATYGYVD